jgi:hypothetical protein
MIDVNKITSTLAKLPDQQLQQYAQMHKSDPYIMALAMSESNRRKEMRSAGQGAQGMQEQPKVVDQMVAEMAPQQLPEEMGIGQLPAGNMNFAGGGIIAFADGGDVERYQVGGMMGDIPGFVAGTGNLIPQQGAPEEVPLFRRMFRDARAVGANYQLEQAKARIAAGVGTSADEAIIAAAQPAQSTAPSPQDMAQFDAASNLYMTERAAKQAAATTKAADAAPKVDTSRKVPVAGLGAAAAAGPKAASADKEPAGLDSIMAEFTRKQELAQGAAKNADVQYASSLRGEAAKLVADEEKRIKDQVDPYKDREVRLLKQEKGLEGMGDKYLGLALLQAGAAMMTTPGGIGAALGKGVQVGSERYIQGIEKINAAKDKFAEARDRLDDLRLNRSDMNARDIKAAKTEARTLERQAEALFYTGAREDLKMTDKNLTTLLGVAADDLKTTRQIEAERANTLTREAGAYARNKTTTDAALQDPKRLAFLSALEKTKTKENPKGDPAAAYQSIVAMQAEPRSQEKLRGDWLDMAKRMQIQADYPNIKTFEDYVTVFGGGAGSAGGAGGDGFSVVGVRPAK